MYFVYVLYLRYRGTVCKCLTLGSMLVWPLFPGWALLAVRRRNRAGLNAILELCLAEQTKVTELCMCTLHLSSRVSTDLGC